MERDMEREKDNPGVDLGLSESEKELLLQIAHSAIKERIGRMVEKPDISSLSGKLSEPRGAFVSLYKKGMLRGCLGSIVPEKELAFTVAEMAAAAATSDPRFRPVAPEELPYIDVEVSALTPFEEIDDPERINVGVHGLMIRKGPVSGLLLPQVAAERKWDKETFLRETCRKAGLDANAWKDEDTRIYVFSADVFS
jgi:AmmeMemoRadiSam system protein A